jgi:Tfp pilus assembly protein PilF
MPRQRGRIRRGVLFVLCLFLSAAAASQTAGDTGTRGSYTVTGYVRDDETREALRSAVVTLTQNSGNVAAPTVYTGTTGEFMFAGLNSGEYHVTAKFAGYETASTTITLGGTSLLTIEVTLRKSDRAATPLAAGDAVSAHELTVPFNARDDYDKGLKLLTLAKPNYAKAIAQFQRAIKEFSTYYEAYAEMSIGYYHLGQAQEAEKALRTSISLSKSQFSEALLLLAEMLDDQNRFVEAEPVARQAVTIQESWRGHLSLARALSGLNRANDAEVSALKASLLDPNNPQIFLVLGNIHIQQRKYALVVQDFDSYLRLNPTGPESDAVRNTQKQARNALQRTQVSHN